MSMTIVSMIKVGVTIVDNREGEDMIEEAEESGHEDKGEEEEVVEDTEVEGVELILVHDLKMMTTEVKEMAVTEEKKDSMFK